LHPSHQRNAPQDSLKYDRDLKNSLDTSFEDGEKVGLEKGELIGLEKGELSKAIKIAEKCLLKGLSIEETVEMTELSVEKIREIAKKLKS
jgi:predicted transposase YdaD